MVADPKRSDKRNDKPYVIMALQGGGALGAFQAGAYKALSEKGFEPDWVAGISIGAINASIIAGNPQQRRLPRLMEFWKVVAGSFDWWDYFPNYSEKLTDLWKVWLSMAGGVPGFFRPNYVPPPFAPPGSAEACCLYDAQKLKTTLQRLIDFNFLNNYAAAEHVRLSLGATRVFGGVQKTFENFGGPNPSDPDCQYACITPDHIMASGAMAPWFPGVVIDHQLYWDGGISSNSSFRHVIKHLPGIGKVFGTKPVVIFLIDLWGAFDREPKTFDEVCWRIKQIQYSSRIEQDIHYAKHFIYRHRGARDTSRIDIIRVSYRNHPNEIPCGDALFSRTEIERRIQDGYGAMSYRLESDPPLWELKTDLRPDNQPEANAGVVIHLF
jgi:NTE family protein